MLSAYAVGMVVGGINEFIQKPKQVCFMKNPPYNCALSYGGSSVYGWSLVALTAVLDLNRTSLHLPGWVVALSMGPILAALECAMGQVSWAYFKERKWEYPKHYLPTCNGYISLLSTAYFAVGGILYWKLIYQPMISKL